MKYDAQNNRFTVSIDSLSLASHNFRYALRNVRKAAGLPLDKYKSDVQLTPADHAQKGIIDGAKVLGIDLGADWGADLDLRE